jgi:hypothetical protein
VLVAEHLKAELLDLTSSAMQITDSVRLASRARGADVVIVSHGVTEAIVRPAEKALRLLPARYRRAGWLDPRPYFSRRPVRRLGQRVESSARWRVKVLLMRLLGRQCWCDVQTYEVSLGVLLRSLDTARVFVVGSAAVDDRFFPGSGRSLDEYTRVSQKVAETHGAVFVDLSDVCIPWTDYLADHFHPNVGGHRRIADKIVSLL